MNKRYALGMPSGSIRAILTLMIVSVFCALMLIPTDPRPRIPPHLMYLLVIGVTQFFAAFGTGLRVAGERPPLGLPAGSVRLLIMAALTATVIYRLTDIDEVLGQLKDSAAYAISPESLSFGVLSPLFLPLLLLGGFFVGVIVRRLLGIAPVSAVQDIQAWVALLCVIGMSGDLLLELVINPSMPPADRINLPRWGGVLSTFVAFYYGARS